MIKIDSPSFFPSGTLSVENLPADETVTFLIGDRLEGQMVEWKDAFHALFRFKGHALFVESQFPLCPEMRGTFEVEATSPTLLLRLLPEAEAETIPLRIPFSSFPDGRLLGEELEKVLSNWEGTPERWAPSLIQKTLHALSTLWVKYSTASPPDPDALRMILLSSGLFFEGRLRHLIETHQKGQTEQVVASDLKGLLLRLRAQLESLPKETRSAGETAFLKDLENTVEKILQKLNGYQSLNLSVPDASERCYLLLPLWFENRFHFVEMSLALPRQSQKRESTEGVSLFFLLHLSELGEMGIEVKLREQRLYCRFNVSNTAISAVLDEALPGLTERLSRLGFQPQISLSVQSEEMIHQSWMCEIGRDSGLAFNQVV